MIFSIVQSFGQEKQDQSRKDYYIFPIRPGVRNTLAGTMGELRSSHFHTGIDIRTGGVQGVPVVAAANGYISRIAVSPGGYGNALYILHPNRETTVYAHLKEFSPEIQEYVRQEQYRKKTFQINLFPGEGRFPVAQGDTIALSGNSGSSGGPHLHFDIRDENQHVLNPLFYNFEEIIDYRSPVVRKVAFKTKDIHSRINDQFGRFEFNVKRNGTNWVVDDTISVYGKIAVELYAFDRQDGTRFRTGITEIAMKLDEDEVFHQLIDNISFSKSRNFYYHVNYERIINSGERFHKLYVDDGNELDFYKTNQLNGLIDFKENCDHIITIDMYDSYGNHSSLIVPVTCTQPSKNTTASIPGKQEIDMNSYRIQENTLIVYADQQNLDPEDNKAVFYVQNSGYETSPEYIADKLNVYLWDLRTGLPDSIDLCNSSIKPKLEAMVPSGVPYDFYGRHMDISFTPRSLFDSLYLQVNYQGSFLDSGELFTIGTEALPMRSNIDVKLKPSKTYADKARTHIYSVDDSGNFSFAGGEWSEENIIFETRNFGSYTLITDTVAPKVKPLIVNHEKLVFRIDDELSGIKEFNMYVNDEWVLMNWEPKKSQIWSEKLDPSKPFEGSIVLSVVDNAGNEKIHQTKLAKHESSNR